MPENNKLFVNSFQQINGICLATKSKNLTVTLFLATYYDIIRVRWVFQANPQ